MDLEISAVGRDTLDRCDFDGAYEDRARLKLTYWPSPAQADKWIISDNERIVDISFGRTILESWQRLLADESGNDRTLGLGEDHVVFVWR